MPIACVLTRPSQVNAEAYNATAATDAMTTAIVVMFSLEIGAILLLFGAQVISEYERVGRNEHTKEPIPMTTGKPR